MRKGVARAVKRKNSSPSPSPSPSSSKKLRFDKSLHKSMITVRVGSGADMETFVMHKELVAYHSTKLARMMDDPIKAEFPGILELPQFESAKFQIFEAWIYRQQLDDDDQSFTSSAFLYMFAEKLGLPGLQNAVLELMGEMIRDNSKWVPTEPLMLNFIWDNTLPGSQLRTLAVDVLVFEDCGQHAKDYPPDLTLRILKAMKKRMPGRMKNEVAPFDVSMEQYFVKDARKEVEDVAECLD